MTLVELDPKDLACPMPGPCLAPLRVVWESAYTLAASDVFGEGAVSLPAQTDAHVGTWRIDCLEGHVILLPGPVGCGCEDAEPPQCGHDALAYDWNEDYRHFQPSDLARLRKLVVDLSRLAQ